MNPDLIKGIKAAARRYKDTYGSTLTNNAINAIGVGDSCIRIYLQNTNDKEKLPTTFEGLSVEIVVIGTITTLGS